MKRNRLATLLTALACLLLAANLVISLRGTPASAQTLGSRDDQKPFRVQPSNLGQDLEDRLNAMASRGYRPRQILTANGTPTTWVVYEKERDPAARTADGGP